MAEWTETVIKAAEELLSSKVDSWQTGVNRNVEGRNVRRVLGTTATAFISVARRTKWPKADTRSLRSADERRRA